MKAAYKKFILGTLTLGLLSCGAKKELKTVESVDLSKYVGKWYEIARLPNSFEKNLDCVTAEYSFLDDDKIKVVNTGRSTKTNQFKSANGKAWLQDPNETGKLKVSFFWPFSGDYCIIYLDNDYKYALVGDPSREYLWILSRSPKMEEEYVSIMLDYAKTQGFDVQKMEFINQDCFY